MEVTFDLAVLLWIAGAIITFATAIGIVYKVAMKLTNTEKIQHIEECIHNDNKRLNSLEQDIKEIKDNQKVILHSVYVMLQHFATNNGKEEIKKELDKMVNYMTDR